MNLSDFIAGCEKISNFTNEVDIQKLINDLKKINESQKVTVPKFIDDWIFKAQLVDRRSIRSALETATIRLYAKNSDEVITWLKDISNQDTFARAWANDYTVEKEKRYIVKVKGLISACKTLKYDTSDGTWYMGRDEELMGLRFRHTRKELEEAGFGDVFNSQLFEVEEVEE